MDVCRQLDWSKPSERGIGLISIISEECSGVFRDDLGGGHVSFLNCFAVKNKLFQQKYPQLCVFFMSGDVWGLGSGSLLACSWHANVGSQIHLTGHLLSVKWIYGCGEKNSSSSQREVELQYNHINMSLLRQLLLIFILPLLFHILIKIRPFLSLQHETVCIHTRTPRGKQRMLSVCV